ncbi:MAG TPA: ABC transporter permease [Gemmatimonadaceae bacterium]|nr:ABC transporter permease [Gemmatimonadaceae bacterium]
MDSLWKDTRVAFRMLRKNPAFALVAIVTLALGIGASTAIFSVVNAVLLRPLPYKDADRLAIVWSDMRNRNVNNFPMSPADFRDLRATTKTFSQLAGVSTFKIPFAGDGYEPEQVPAAFVTTNLFSVLGTHVMMGRDFVDADATPQPPPPNGATGGQASAPQAPPLPAIMILSYEFWKRRYGGDASIIGKSLELGGLKAQVVGVAQPGFELLFTPAAGIERTPDVYVAQRINFGDNSPGARINVFLRVVGRLAPGATLAQARQEIDAFAADQRAQFPIEKTAGVYMRVEPMHADLVSGERPAILALMGAVVFVLLIACANVANLLLVRASSRERELAIRSALGGSRLRLVRQMMLESLLLGASGAVVGLWAAALGITVLVRLAPTGLPRLDEIRIDPLVLGFTIAAGLVAVLVFGTVPALRASRPDLMDVLRASGRTTGQRAGALMRNGVVVAEVALSLVLLIGCGLMVRSFVALEQTDPGFDPNGLLTFFATPSRRTPPGPNAVRERATFVRTFAEQLRAIPGVQSVTAASQLPLEGNIGNARWGTAEALTDPSKFKQANVHVVIPGYFATMRTKLIAGRDFSEADDDTAAKNIIIDDKLAARAFPGQNAVGQRLLARIVTDVPLWYTVVGVVAHERDETLASDGREVLFLSDGETGSGAVARWVLRTAGDPAALAPVVRATVHQFDPTMSVAEMQPMETFVDHAEAPTKFALALIGTFAGIAIVLAAVGLYGVLSTVVRQRTAEIGMRMAFGAPSQSIFGLVIAQGVRLSAIGIVVGLVAAVLLTRAMSTMLVGVRPTDPATYIAISILFLVVATAAAWLPARRAAALDPTIALREE